MTKNTLFSLLIISLLAGGFLQVQGQDQNFNDLWLFFNDTADGAENADFDDSNWRELDLPHDWAIEGPFDIKYNARCGRLPF